MTKSIRLLHSTALDKDITHQNLIALLLKNRGITNLEEFISPPYPTIKLKLKSAVKIINQAIAHNQNILIYGDYDVDGITATAILWQSLYKNYHNITPFIPHRERDGYGVKAASFFRFQKEKGIIFDLLITVDNGIVAGKELEKIRSEQNIDIIVTDHHLSLKNDLPSVRAIIHSTKTSGAGVAWFLAREFDQQADLGLAALGAVADCVPLVGINRSIVVHGLQSLRLNPSPGIRKLITISGAKPDSLSTYDLGYLLGPRINAVGRLADPTDALRLLCSQNSLQASRYAQTLNSYNQDRQVLQSDLLEKAESSISKGGSRIRPTDRLLFISGSYNPGIIGLIAGRLTEKYYLPSIVIAIDGDIAKGSCRSIPELNIIESLREHSDLFIDLGGHPGAAGFSLHTKNVAKLKKAIIKTVNTKLKKQKLEPHLDVDAQISLDAVNTSLIKTIQALAPFGIGNPEPLFLLKDLTIQSIRTIGQTNDHLKLKLNNIEAIYFKKGDLISKLKVGDSVDVVASLSLNTWNNQTTPQLIIKEIIL